MGLLNLDNLTEAEQEDLFNYLYPFVTANKKQRFREVLANRTRHLTVVLEDLYQSHNISAAIRSCECFGIQDVHIIEKKHSYQINPHVLKGASKWVSFHRYRTTEAAIQSLKKAGYALAVTSPHLHDSISVESLPLEQKVALAFGTELRGATNTLLQEADYKVYVPMYGFTESFNVSVSVALCLQTLVHLLKADDRIAWQLTEAERKRIHLEWVMKAVTNVQMHIKRFLKSNG